MKNVIISLFSLFLAFIFTSSTPNKNYYSELYRPQFHFTPEKNRMENPSGLVYYDREYHLFYKYDPNNNEMGFKHWGHAVSTDLVHWEHLPVALTADENCNLLSGSAIVDEKNLLGKEQGDEKTMVIFYTSLQSGQHIAYSTDRGRTWQKFEGNPVIQYNTQDGACDPKVLWHEPSQIYIMLLCRKNENDDKLRGVSFYTSENLVDWEFQSHIYGFNESADLVQMPVSNNPGENKWVLFGGDGSYLVGNFDGKEFLPETGKMKSDFGKNYYATQTWNNLPVENNRILQIAWMRDGNFPEMPFIGQMSFPSELTLTHFTFGYKITRKPVAEIKLLHDKHYDWENEKLIPGINQNIVKNVKGDCFHIVGEFDLKSCNVLGFYVRNSRKKVGTEILYDVKRGTLSMLGTTAPLLPIDNKITLEIIIDRTSIEVYANNGQTVISNCFTPDEGSKDMILFSMGDEVMVNKLDIFKLNSAWNPEN